MEYNMPMQCCTQFKKNLASEVGLTNSSHINLGHTYNIIKIVWLHSYTNLSFPSNLINQMLKILTIHSHLIAA